MAMVERALDYKPPVSASPTVSYWGTRHTEEASEAVEVRNSACISRQRCLTSPSWIPLGPLPL